MKRMKITNLLLVVFLVTGISTGFYSCEDEVGTESMYTFKKETMGQYIESNPDLSDFAMILQRTKTIGMLKAYGIFTCFAPDNNALKAFYEKKGKTSIDDFTPEELKQIAYDHLISGDSITTAYLGEGRLGKMTMSNRFISVSYSSTDIYINSNSKLLEKDISVHNGITHVISEVIDPARYGIAEAILQDEKFSLFAEALVGTGLNYLIQRDMDESYDPNLYTDLIIYPKETNPAWRYDEIPWQKKYGYTVFMESDETMNQNGIYDMESLKKYAAEVYDKVYPEDADIDEITDRRNSLNRFVAYHLIDKELSRDKLIDAYDNANQIKIYDMYEYLETMCPNTLIEIKKDRKTGETNLINPIASSGKAIRLTNYYDQEAQNGVYHEVNEMLVYDENVLNEHSSKRLRFDMASFFPEFTNNNIRGRKSTLPCAHIFFPRGYLENIETSEQTTLGYVASNDRLLDYQGDELFMEVQPGKLYDFTITTPPVPAGTYEVRVCYSTGGRRGVCQIYFDDIPTGVPINLSTSGRDPSIGWQDIFPGDPIDPYGYENDKMMRNQGYMKGPASYTAPDKAFTQAADGRQSPDILRNILGIYTFDKAAKHRLMVKGLSSGQFMMDFMEFIPISAIESEDIF